MVPPEDVFTTECDVFAPCAVGAILNEDTIPLLRCSGVAGSANNQLREDADADLLQERGILYAPDYIANGGGAMAFGLIFRGGTDHVERCERVSTFGTSLDEIFGEAAEEGISTLVSSVLLVERILIVAREPAVLVI